MKQTVLEILQYLFDHCIDEAAKIPLDRGVLQAQLVKMGFDHNQVEKAFDWLQAFSEESQLEPRDARSLRLYIPVEQEKLGNEGIGFLLLLEQAGILEHHTRELVINRVMALEGETVDLHQLEWIVFMVLVNQPHPDASVMWLDHLFSQENSERKLH